MTRPLLSSIAIRQAALTALVVVAATAAFAVTALWSVQRAIRADLVRTIDTDMAGLADGMAQGGLGEVERRIGDRTAVRSSAGGAAFYLLRDRDGRALAGNLTTPPLTDPNRSALGRATVDGKPVLVRATRLRGGAALFVGRSLGPEATLIAALGRHFLLAALATVLAALIVGLAVARGLAGRIDRLNRVFRRFQGGESGARVANPQARDEFGVLGRHVDIHLDRITHLLDVQRQVSDNIAHELRTPLVHLDTHLRQAIERAGDAPVTAELEAARASIRSIVSLFDSLLDIALFESESRGDEAAVDLSQLAADAADLYAASAEEAGIDFSTRIAAGVTMPGGAMQVVRLITNLLDNAFKFAGAGAHVRLIVAEGPRIVVEDDGPGVPSRDQELIFTRFGRSASGVEGHGLGLALVKVIAARHGLAVRVEDAAPGARFVVERR